MTSFVAQPTSRKNIRLLATIIRKKFGLANSTFFPIVEFMEFGLPRIDENFILEIVPLNEMPHRYGVTYPKKNKIVIREDVYERAVKGIPRDRFTLAHETGHYIMHSPGSIALARNHKDEKVPAYMDPEWQAHTFAGELLAPPNIIKGLSAEEVSRICGVSLKAAKIQLSHSQ